MAKVEVHKKFLFNKGEDGGIVPFHEGVYEMDDAIANHPWSLGFLTILDEPETTLDEKPAKAKK